MSISDLSGYIMYEDLFIYSFDLNIREYFKIFAHLVFLIRLNLLLKVNDLKN